MFNIHSDLLYFCNNCIRSPSISTGTDTILNKTEGKDLCVDTCLRSGIFSNPPLVTENFIVCIYVPLTNVGVQRDESCCATLL
jgi:hypothetical protein